MSWVDPEHLWASLFLWGAGGAFLVIYALPLLLVPMRWAKAFLWFEPENTDLPIYLGRCLGAVAVAIVLCCFRAAPAPASHPILFELLAIVGALLTVVHIVGGVQGKQPWTETAEIAMYALLTAIAVAIRLTL